MWDSALVRAIGNIKYKTESGLWGYRDLAGQVSNRLADVVVNDDAANNPIQFFVRKLLRGETACCIFSTQPHTPLTGGLPAVTRRRMLGVLLGLTFRVFVLIPAAVLVLIGLATIGAGSEADVCWMIAFDVAIITALEAGYFGGSAVVALVEWAIPLHAGETAGPAGEMPSGPFVSIRRRRERRHPQELRERYILDAQWPPLRSPKRPPAEDVCSRPA
jgi:hypothetical protein